MGDKDVSSFPYHFTGKNKFYKQCIQSDPLVYKDDMKYLNYLNYHRLATTFAVTKALDEVMQNYERVKLPYSMYYGDEDKIVSDYFRNNN